MPISDSSVTGTLYGPQNRLTKPNSISECEKRVSNDKFASLKFKMDLKIDQV